MFKKLYTVRRYGAETEQGFSYTDMTVWLNAQPVTAADLQALSEGDRAVKRIKAFGRDEIRVADQITGKPGDRLWYRERWYECEGASVWDHTPLTHCESQWVAVPENAPLELPPEQEAMTS